MSLRAKSLGIVVLIGAAVLVVWLWFAFGPRPAPVPVAHYPPNAELMQAIVRRQYGSPDVLSLERIEKPAVVDDRVLVRVHASSVNPYDYHFMEGTPYILRLDAGMRVPKSIRLGVDFAGVVEAVGKSVTRFKPGDEVFGGASGALAEYVNVREAGAIALKPARVSFEQAGVVAVAGLTALQALRDSGHIRAGQKVLINGASGGVGTFAVQIAKSFGAEVTGVCSTRNVALVRSIGADHVIDYTRENVTRSGQRYDLILDNVGNYPLLDFRHILTPKGTYLIVGAQITGNWIQPLWRPIKATVLSPFVSQKFELVLSGLKQKDVLFLADLMQSGKLTPVIDRRYTLSEVPAAVRYLEAGHARAKVAIDLSPPAAALSDSPAAQ
ncbi:MAG TPA: NAD(P)-dependent alcohol dehydrogenase [Steroidobacteraceae bacterium]|nr:NAD(P)-dependent alcohol dehydrogenase [Steroidobacteraceae bacterium]